MTAPLDRFSRESAVTEPPVVRTEPVAASPDHAGSDPSRRPALARDDVAPPALPSAGPSSTPWPAPGAIRAAGVTLAVAPLPWVVSLALLGNEGGRVTVLVCLLFQIGVWALLSTMWRTRATGTGRGGRGLLVTEAVLLGLATVSSGVSLAPDAIASSTPAMVLDLTWPLSMLGMVVVGVVVAAAGRWRGVLRWWPLVAGSWFVVVLPVDALVGPTAGSWACGLHLLAGYTTLGILIARRPGLTTPA